MHFCEKTIPKWGPKRAEHMERQARVYGALNYNR